MWWRVMRADAPVLLVNQRDYKHSAILTEPASSGGAAASPRKTTVSLTSGGCRKPKCPASNGSRKTKFSADFSGLFFLPKPHLE